MFTADKLKHEVVTVISLTFYFGCWLSVLLLIKYLLLSEYEVAFSDFSVALIGALVLAKVVLILEHVELGPWVGKRSAWIDVLLRTTLYAFGVFVVLLLEKAFHGRHEYGDFWSALIAGFQHADINHVWLNIICLSGALLSYNLLSVVRQRLGKGALLQMFLAPLPGYSDTKNSI